MGNPRGAAGSARPRALPLSAELPRTALPSAVWRDLHELTGVVAVPPLLDLGKVEFIDSPGLRMLLSLRNDAERNGHGLELVAPRPPAQRIFVLTGTRGLFAWRESA